VTDRASSRQSRSIVLSGSELPEEIAAKLQRFGDIEVVEPEDEETWMRLAPRAVAIVARGNTRVPKRLIEAAPGLRVIGRSGVGVDLVDVEEATRRGVPVVITPGSGSNAVAEGAMAMMLTLVKRLTSLDALVRSGRWAAREAVPVGDLEGATLGVVGLGRIGRRLAQLCIAFGMNVKAVDPPAQENSTLPPDGVVWSGLAELLATSDVISLHLPLDRATKSIIDLDRLLSMKRGAILLNLGRGGLISSYDDLVVALDAVPLGGIGIDTFDVEPPDVTHPLFRCDRVLLSPHVLGLSQRARRQIFADMTDGMVRVLTGEQETRVANPAVWSQKKAIDAPDVRQIS
jgi:phosphoglycerate dehydrogenase-like enzyme